MNVLLISVIWLQGSPMLQSLPMISMKQCLTVAETTAEMIAKQAKTNMTGGHNVLQFVRDVKQDELVLLTGTVGREVARFRCTSTGS